MRFFLTSRCNYRIIVPTGYRTTDPDTYLSVPLPKIVVKMKAEKVILSFVAVFVGLIAAGIAFYLYQSTKALPSDQPKASAMKVSQNPTPTPSGNDIFTVDTPQDGLVSDKKLITVKGTTVKGAIVTVSTDDSDQVVQPASNGDFTLTQTIPDGTSLVDLTVIFPDGTQKTIDRTVTFSTANF